jgi:TolA-binding protein
MRHIISFGIVILLGLTSASAEEETKTESTQPLLDYIQELTGKIDELTRTVDELQKRITVLEVNSCPQKQEVNQKALPETPAKSSPVSETLSAQKADRPTASAEALWSKGTTDLQRKDFASAEKAFVEIVRFYPNHARAPEASYWLGEIFLINKQYTDAQKYYALAYKAFAESDSRKAEVGLKIAECYFALNKNKEGCLFLKEIMKLKQKGANISSATLQLMQKYWAQHKCAG